jgi:hypothetical protein
MRKGKGTLVMLNRKTKYCERDLTVLHFLFYEGVSHLYNKHNSSFMFVMYEPYCTKCVPDLRKWNLKFFCTRPMVENFHWTFHRRACQRHTIYHLLFFIIFWHVCAFCYLNFTYNPNCKGNTGSKRYGKYP